MDEPNPTRVVLNVKRPERSNWKALGRSTADNDLHVEAA
jgi:hypothetical protein